VAAVGPKREKAENLEKHEKSISFVSQILTLKSTQVSIANIPKTVSHHH
jgi:hypothetical protein